MDECRAPHTPVAIAPFPHLSSGLPAGAYEFGALHDNVPDLCRAESIPCVDLVPTFPRYQDYRTLWVHRYDPVGTPPRSRRARHEDGRAGAS
jgi:hypothetical protein